MKKYADISLVRQLIISTISSAITMRFEDQKEIFAQLKEEYESSGKAMYGTRFQR